MAGEQASTTRPPTSGVAFEVDRFGWAGAERLELAGRWYGLRGHRFVRPALTVAAKDGPRRMLAVLDHKPWAAEDGEPWFAAFRWDGEPVESTGAELAVAPNVAVQLPAPAVPGRTRSRSRAAPARHAAHELAALRAQLDAEQRTVRRLAAELDAAHERLAEAEAADAQRAELERARDAALTERDDARAALEVARRETAAARDAAVLDHGAVRDERDAAMHAQAAAQQERDEALDQRSVSAWERRAAIAERDAALAERDQAIEAHRAAAAQLDEIERRVRGAGRPAAEPAPAEQHDEAPAPARLHRRRRDRQLAVAWLQRLIALALLVAWAFVVYKVLQGVV